MTSRSGWTRRGALASLTAAAAACGKRPEAPPYAGALQFAHGVASGDPGAERVIIWTRVSPHEGGPVPVRWVLARNRALSDVVATGVVEANAARDYTVKVDVSGLRPGAPYFYGFLAGDQASSVGRTRTLSRSRLNRLRLAVVSCASFPHGFFNVYEAIARREDVDIVVHLGDYIYEYGLDGYGGDSAVALGRIPRPEIECVSLEDYRQRHAQAKAEPELQAAHALCPWIVAWDDHEAANDCWSGGAENHNDGEGDWESRRRAALQAYYEWMPIREPGEGGAFAAINRAFQFGDLATFFMLETRHLARTRPFDYARDTPLYATPWDFSNPDAPRALHLSEARRPGARLVPVPYRVVGRELVPIFDWPEVARAIADPAHAPADVRFMPDVPALKEKLGALDRAMLGAAQEQWLSEQLAASTQEEVVWQVLGSQVLMGEVLAPDLSRTPPEVAAALERLRPGVTALLDFTRRLIPLNPDAWDGYPRARDRVLAMLREAGANALVVSGDSHAAWVNDIADHEGRVAVEFGTTSVTSPGDADYFTAGGVDFAGLLMERNSAKVKWTDQSHRGFLLLTLERSAATAEFFTVSSVRSKEFEVARAAVFEVRAGRPGAPGLSEPTRLAEEAEKSR